MTSYVAAGGRQVSSVPMIKSVVLNYVQVQV